MMIGKHFSLLAVLSALFSSSAVFADPQVALMTQVEEEEVLTEINNLCGDTWCEGDFNYVFSQFSCSPLTKGKTECTLRFSLESYDDENKVEATFPTQCVFSDLRDKEDIFYRERGEVYIDDDFYEQLSYCFNEAEADFRELLRK